VTLFYISKLLSNNMWDRLWPRRGRILATFQKKATQSEVLWYLDLNWAAGIYESPGPSQLALIDWSTVIGSIEGCVCVCVYVCVCVNGEKSIHWYRDTYAITSNSQTFVSFSKYGTLSVYCAKY
jgi:hypothetical protein